MKPQVSAGCPIFKFHRLTEQHNFVVTTLVIKYKILQRLLTILYSLPLYYLNTLTLNFFVEKETEMYV